MAVHNSKFEILYIGELILAYLLGGTAFLTALAGIFVAALALRKVQSLTVEFVKAHVQGIRTDTAKQAIEIKNLTQKIAKLEATAKQAAVKKTEKAAQTRYNAN